MLFQMDVLTLAQAAGVAGLHRMQFQEELAKRKIPLHYGVEELEEDLKTLNIVVLFYLSMSTGDSLFRSIDTWETRIQIHLFAF